ncbi:MAG TPA: TM2 domain-containing protein [Anaerolineaceae bacterium]|jgi:TM2 domain-containing membrane protein YozV|nr:TM2 domain-containing protein [Anaerolineaceae bacterium]
MYCSSCGSKNEEGAAICVSCGASLTPATTPVMPPPPNYQSYPQPVVSSKNKTTAGILAILLGGIGVHKFYLGETGMGIVYLLFSWTGIPLIIGLIEGIIYLTQSDQEFASKHP